MQHESRKETYEAFVELFRSNNTSDLEMGFKMLQNFGFKHATKQEALVVCKVLVNRAIPIIRNKKLSSSDGPFAYLANKAMEQQIQNMITKLSNKFQLRITEIIDYYEIGRMLEAENNRGRINSW